MKKNLKDKISDFFFLEDDAAVEDNFETAQEAATIQQAAANAGAANHYKMPNKRNVVSMNQTRASSHTKIKIVEPRFETDAENIADMLLDGESVVLNVRRMDQAQAVKMINFLQGTIYAIGGDMERIGEEIFVCAPQTVDLVLSELEVNERDFFNSES
ncbi:cell division protein SepF [Allofustis seminis]|uniref:cell division protein SepF n=1 Tax=Allofustis seminis TaxID=166939 RepID=UPI0003813E67|nr:cell division protein SepF [Allofustis seminis]